MARPRNVANQYIPSIYDKDKHPQLLISLFEEGAEFYDFCSALNIGEKTFYLWLRLYPELAEAYDIAKSKAAAWLIKQGRSSMHAEHFQSKVWERLIINRCRLTDYRTVPIDFTNCKTANEKLLKIEQLLAEGQLVPTEAKILTDMVKSGAEINQQTEVVKKLDELEDLIGKK